VLFERAAGPADVSKPGRLLRVVLFSGGRGSRALTRQLVTNQAVSLTLAINGYDDGASTGEVRRFLGDALGPSDFRKNASTLAAALRTCESDLIDWIDLRFPHAWTRERFLALVSNPQQSPRNALAAGSFEDQIDRLSRAVAADRRNAVWERLEHFASELVGTNRPFEFADCSLGNLVFAGSFLRCERRFNRAVDDYSSVLGIPAGMIENVTDGTNAFLVAVDERGQVLESEEQIVDPAGYRRIRDIYLIDRPLSPLERQTIEAGGAEASRLWETRAVRLSLNPRLASRIASADLIIYAPGTQHSSLFPSYLTPGLGELIASNLAAIKLLITNIMPDSEITGSNATEIVDRALYYLKNRGRGSMPAPCLITHYLLNDPTHPDDDKPYVPLGPVESIEDPRLIRISNYEDGVTGRHDAARVLNPFITSITGRDVRRRVAILLHDSGSINKVTQTLLELVRGNVTAVPVTLAVFYAGSEALDPAIAARFPFAVSHLADGETGFAAAARAGAFEYVLLFEASGMYRGEDTVAVLSLLAEGRLDAVWGSRRLSVRDIGESYRHRYQHNALMGAVSRVGSHLLSLTCLLRYGRYISDTLSGLRAIRAADALDPGVDLTRKDSNHLLLSRLLRRKAEILEVPVRFFPLSPERVIRTTPLDGLRALTALLRSPTVARSLRRAPHHVDDTEVVRPLE
jgi:2-phospho-L-lactate transferase/gluconeogenesis factor (CofD/UPF0052 family)